MFAPKLPPVVLDSAVEPADRVTAIDFINRVNWLFDAWDIDAMLEAFLPDSVTHHTHGISRGKVETRSDLYALGATMHHALSGRDPTTEPPFSFPLLRKLCPDLNPVLADLVSEALIYDVERRVRDVDEMKHRLLAIRDGAVTAGIGGQITGPVAQGHSQLQLPLKTPPTTPPAPPSAFAPTLLTVTDDIPCPACTRSIPGDSRFCSYCAADLRQHFGPPQQISESEAQTITLTEPAQTHYQTSSTPHPARQRRHPRGKRSPFVTLLIVAGLMFLVLRAFSSGCTALTKGEDVKVLVPSVSGDLNALQVDAHGHIGWTKSYYLDEPAQ